MLLEFKQHLADFIKISHRRRNWTSEAGCEESKLILLVNLFGNYITNIVF